jgi:hypothetical protein
MTEESPAASIDRRAVLRRGAAVGTLVWAAPVVQSMTWSAAAGERHGTIGSGRPCSFNVVVQFCIPKCFYGILHGKKGWHYYNQWYQVTVALSAEGECCDKIGAAVQKYQESTRSTRDALCLVGELKMSGCCPDVSWVCTPIEKP